MVNVASCCPLANFGYFVANLPIFGVIFTSNATVYINMTNISYDCSTHCCMVNIACCCLREFDLRCCPQYTCLLNPTKTLTLHCCIVGQVNDKVEQNQKGKWDNRDVGSASNLVKTSVRIKYWHAANSVAPCLVQKSWERSVSRIRSINQI